MGEVEVALLAVGRIEERPRLRHERDDEVPSEKHNGEKKGDSEEARVFPESYNAEVHCVEPGDEGGRTGEMGQIEGQGFERSINGRIGQIEPSRKSIDRGN